ncbi:MAG: hypothetical protein IH598_13135 [Bacteroidales bacterium]|nr:hypothetical protein [Bacteroidales bacterium]
MRYRYRKYFALLIVFLILGIVFFFPFTVPFNFRSTAWIQPIKKWTLRADLEGNFYGELTNYKTGAIELSTSYRFERGDIATLSLREGMANNVIVDSGDTLGFLYSRLVEERIQQLKNLSAVEKKQLQSSSTGEKVEIVENLKQKLTLAEQNFDFSRKNYERLSKLFQDSVITESEFEIAETEYLSAITNIEIAKSDYEIAKTGQKPEEIRLIQERIDAYENEIEFLLETKTKYLLQSPVSGKMVFTHYLTEQTEYISVTDTSGFILYIPVKFPYKPYLTSNMELEFMIPGIDERISAEIIDISDRVEQIKSDQVIFIKAIVKKKSPLIVPGLSVQCIFLGEQISLREYIKRTMDIFFR